MDVWNGGNGFGSVFFGFDVFGQHAWPDRDLWTGEWRFFPLRHFKSVATSVQDA